MNYISDLTKRDIFSILKNGIDVYQQQSYLVENKINTDTTNLYTSHLNIFGRLDELQFLERLYNLDEMESYDSRFPTFKGDIIQHRYNNYDWEDYLTHLPLPMKALEENENLEQNVGWY